MISNWTIIIPALVAIIGWLYTARRNREQMRRQHTFNALLQVSFNKDYHENLLPLIPFIREERAFPVGGDMYQSPVKEARYILNHYEFIATGIRTGDIDERLFKDSEKGTVTGVYCALSDFIYHVRKSRDRDTVFEHIEWLNDRWSSKKPGCFQKIGEFIIAKPFQGKRR